MNTVYFIILISLIIQLLLIFHKNRLENLFLLGYVGFGFVMELIGWFNYHNSILHLEKLYFIVSSVSLSLFFSINKNRVLKKYYIIVCIMLFLFFVLYHNVDSHLENIVMVFVYTIYFILLSLFELIDIFKHSEFQKIYHNRRFWISIAMLLWSVFALFKFVTRFYFNIIDPSFLELQRLVFYLVNIITYSLFIIGNIFYTKWATKQNS